MSLSEDAFEALTQSELKMKSFRKTIMSLLFEWQHLETHFELTNTCFQKALQLQESISHKSIQTKEIALREKNVEEHEKSIKLEKEQLEDEKKCITEKENQIKQCLQELELKEKNLETMQKELDLREKELNSRENQVDSSNQSMPHINESETLFDNQPSSIQRSRSRAWMHFTKIVKRDGLSDKAKCNYCHKLFSAPGGTTTSLLHHFFNGKCPAYQKNHSACQNHEVLGQSAFQQSIGVQKEGSSVKQSDIREETRTPLMKDQNPISLPSKLQTRLRTEPQMSSSKTCAIDDTTLCRDLNYQPCQPKYPHKDPSDLLLEKQSLKTRIADTSQLLTDYSGSGASRENRNRMQNSDSNCQDVQIRPTRNFGSVETESGNTREQLKFQGQKRNRENESYNYLYHEDLSTPVRNEEAWYNNFPDDDDVKPKDLACSDIDIAYGMITSSSVPEILKDTMNGKGSSTPGKSIPL